ncbi:iron-sulfur cluster biosynthesis family protein [Salipaludibacillus daqingensis]|uniref:iron-sulfur cluster biosynthesis family protein n=1 Tax=Salipaludibacillus daqingensis TaxID=3041001 RepID=UPI0024752F6B|nr:iron-sulfur cluster biosynthesis family protein [Salipaludibacillus daqingensis]
MNLTITDKASSFYKQEMKLSEGDTVSFFVRVGGVGSGGFSVGIYRGTPDMDYKSTEQAGVIFCVTEEDQWYFDGMVIDYHEDYGEVTFNNKNMDDVSNP